jgi:hypothetical protein
MERRARDKFSLRAELTWDDDRRFEAEVLGRDLAKDPAETVALLMKTPQGCEWLMGRWALLAHAANTNEGAWTDEQTNLAFDLLATPKAFRAGRRPGAVLDFEGNIIDAGENLAAVARREVALLKEKREVVAGLDEVERTLAASDLTNEGDPELRRLRRYESTLHGRLRWFLKQITIQSPYRCPDPSLRPEWVVDLEPEPEVKPEPNSRAEGRTPEQILPPIDLEPEESPGVGQDSDRPVHLTPRMAKQIRMAEARAMVSRKKKVERLRA